MIRIHLLDADFQRITTQDRYTVPKEGEIIRLTLNGQPERFQVIETQHNWDVLPLSGVALPHSHRVFNQEAVPEEFLVIARQLESHNPVPVSQLDAEEAPESGQLDL